MIDKDRVLVKVDELQGYLKELRQITPAHFNDYQKIEIKRSCERLLQICVECTMDICNMLVAGLRLGVPSEENDVLEKLGRAGFLSNEMEIILKEMRGFRNILVHEYAVVDDRIVFETARTRQGDFQKFIKEILQALKQ